ncbi:MAG TPA: hypothetical protein PLE54_10255 [Burkholderiaceae bacterium]|nr:hypothetical protein [Burkholderiaceae bacterium]HQR70974.1 hypothetical protein [Burkholderiaceae bacterium]
MHRLGRHLQAQPRLAEPAHAEQGDHARLLEQRLDLADLDIAADERSGLEGQVVRNVPDRHPPVGGLDDPVRLLRVRGRHTARPRSRDFEQFDRVGNALDDPVTVRLQFQVGGTERLARFRRQQRLPTSCDRHDACRGRLHQAFHLERLGAPRDILGTVLPQDHGSDVHSGPRLQWYCEGRQRRVIRHREGHGIADAFEHHQHAVGLVDLATRVLLQQIARHTIVRGPSICHGGVTDALGQLRAVDHVGQQKDPDVAHSDICELNRLTVLQGCVRTATKWKRRPIRCSAPVYWDRPPGEAATTLDCVVRPTGGIR